MMPRWILPALVISGVLVVALSIGLFLSGDDPLLVRARTPDPNLVDLKIPDFELLNQYGEPVDATIFDGKITILDFIFTNCPFICPGMNQRMRMLQDDLAGTGVRFMSISIDPLHDTPEVLREYAKALPADLGRWSFLTGDQEQTWSIARDGLLFDVSIDAARQIEVSDGETMSNLNHPSKLILIGPGREVLGLYTWSMDDEMGALESRARILGKGN